MSDISLADVQATKCTYFFYICRQFVFCDHCFSLICKIIKNWCVNIYSVPIPIFIIAQFQTHQIPKSHNQKHHKCHLQTQLFQPLLYMHHLRKYQSMQKQSSNTYIILLILLAHTYTILWKVFNEFLMAGNWKKRKICQF